MPEEMRREDTQTREEAERRRQEYVRRLRESTRELAERMRRSEQLTADDFAFRINATKV